MFICFSIVNACKTVVCGYIRYSLVKFNWIHLTSLSRHSIVFFFRQLPSSTKTFKISKNCCQKQILALTSKQHETHLFSCECHSQCVELNLRQKEILFNFTFLKIPSKIYPYEYWTSHLSWARCLVEELRAKLANCCDKILRKKKHCPLWKHNLMFVFKKKNCRTCLNAHTLIKMTMVFHLNGLCMGRIFFPAIFACVWGRKKNPLWK